MPGGTDIALGNEQLDELLYVTGVTYPTLAANAASSNTLTVPGLLVGDCVTVNLAAPIAHLTASSSYVSAPNTLTVWWDTDATGITGAATATLIINVVRASRPYTSLPSQVA